MCALAGAGEASDEEMDQEDDRMAEDANEEQDRGRNRYPDPLKT